MPPTSVTRPAVVLLLVTFLVFVLVTPASAGADDKPIKLKRGFLKPLRFNYQGGGDHRVYDFFGMSFTSEFQETMSQYPPALKTARGSFFYNGLALAGIVTILGFSVKMLVDTIGDAEDVSEGKLVDDSFDAKEIIPFVVGGVVTIVGAVTGSSRLKKGVRMFNANHEGSDDMGDSGSGDSGSRRSLKLLLGVADSAPHPSAEARSRLGIRIGFSYGGN